MTKSNILVFAGSLRTESFNKKLARVGASLLKEAGANVTFLDLRDYSMPLYDGDIQDSTGLPDTAIALKKLIHESDGLLIASPEYNYAIPGVLKNAIDWTSRAHEPNEKPLAVYTSKIVAIMSASPSPAGGIRGLVHLRMVLGGIGMLVLPEQATLAKAHEAFNEDGSLKDVKMQASVKQVTDVLIRLCSKF